MQVGVDDPSQACHLSVVHKQGQSYVQALLLRSCIRRNAKTAGRDRFCNACSARLKQAKEGMWQSVESRTHSSSRHIEGQRR